jgi:hypothetical protein
MACNANYEILDRITADEVSAIRQKLSTKTVGEMMSETGRSYGVVGGICTGARHGRSDAEMAAALGLLGSDPKARDVLIALDLYPY